MISFSVTKIAIYGDKMSSILETGNNKTKCQKFTPDTLVQTMLDLANYRTDLMGKTVLENSFGTGQILKAIVVRYIESALRIGCAKEKISKGLSKDIYGLELDKNLFNNCISELNAVVQKYGLPKVEWQLYNGDALSANLNTEFDFVIGNPPYISYKELDTENRETLREKYASCTTGKFDYCYAFIESGIKSLGECGILVQLIPNNIYKNVFGKKLRNMMRDHISVIYDYPDQKLFGKTLTSVSIFVYDKKNSTDKIVYKNVTHNHEKQLLRSQLGDKWVFSDALDGSGKLLRFGDFFHASISIATLFNQAYLVDEKCVRENDLENEILKKAVSPKTLRANKELQIIFPYRYDNGNCVRYHEQEFKELFPNVVKHLQKHATNLDKRNSDKNAAWFEYGRSQALSHINQEKLLISTIVTNEVEVYHIDAETIPYSGIFITTINNGRNLNDAITILKSARFMEYIRSIGISVSGKSLRITCKDINDYLFLE